MYVYVYVCVLCMYICMYMCVYACICMHMHPQEAQLGESSAQPEPKLAPISHVGLKLGPERFRWAPKLMHMEVQVASKVAQLGTLWQQLHTKLGTLLQTKRAF